MVIKNQQQFDAHHQSNFGMLQLLGNFSSITEMALGWTPPPYELEKTVKHRGDPYKNRNDGILFAGKV